MTDVFFPAWLWGPQNRPYMRFLCAAYSEHLTVRDNMRCRSIIISDRYQRLWKGRFKVSTDQFTKIKFANDKTGWKLATSVGGIGTGERADIVIVDDPNNPMEMESEAVRETTKMWFTEVLPDRLNNQSESSIIVIQQRTHEDDVSGIALAREMGYTHLMVPMKHDGGRHCVTVLGVDENNNDVLWEDPRVEEGELAWPERFPENICKELERDKGPYAWCNPYEAPILMADTTLKPIGEVKIGDKIVGFTIGNSEKRARLKPAEVLSISRVRQPIVKITLDSGEVIRCTPNHKWWTGRNDATHAPYAAAKLGSRLARLCPPRLPIINEKQDLRDAGWLAGFFDGEGTVSVSKRRTGEENLLLGFSQGTGRNKPLCDKLERLLAKFGFNWGHWDREPDGKEKGHKLRFYWLKMAKSGRASRFTLYQRFLHIVQPIKWKQRRIDIVTSGRLYCQWEKVVNIQYDGEETAYGLETTTGNYFVWGLASSNSGQYQQAPEPRGGAIIKRDYWRLWDKDKFPPFQYLLASLDTAYTIKEENDASALTIWGVFNDEAGNPKLMLVWAWQDRLEFYELVQKVITTCTRSPDNKEGPRFPVDKLIIESKASGISVAQELYRLLRGSGQFGIDLINPTTYGDKVARAHAVQHMFADEMIYAPDRAYADAVINQCAIFPRGSRDDLVDSTTQALRYLRDCGFAVRREEHSVAVAEEMMYHSPSSRAPLYPVEGMAAPSTKSLLGPFPQLVPPSLSLINGTNHEHGGEGPTFEDGALKIENDDGSVTIDFNPSPDDDELVEQTGFYENLAKRMDGDKLSQIASDLLDGIEADERSRHEWLETRAMGIGLLGLKLEKARSSATDGSAPVEGMSTVRHPLLLEATVSFQATARAELLPAAGPVKVRNDTPTPPKEDLQPTNAQRQLGESLQSNDELAAALEKDMNHYLTSVATEYVPDTDRMLFYIGFGGDGFKKVYNCPLRRRPVSESIDAEDLIISNATTDLQNCGRVTHKISMRKSILKRMQILGVYRDVELTTPTPPAQTPVDQRNTEISGHNPNQERPEDRDHTIYETYCELDLDEYAPTHFKGKGVPLPYRVTIERDSRQILDVRRNWKEDDKECLARQFFVQFPFIRGLGFYGLGFIHLLGNTTNALTAAWRLMLDNGMFSNFPGFLFSKGAGRQNTNIFRVPPGGGVGIDVGAQQSIKDAIMPLPYKEVGPSFSAFAQHVEEAGRQLASTANINVGEGKQEAPVGTTLALIEQATKVLDSAHKRLHAAQAEEFKLLKERFMEDPESFWRHNKQPAKQWEVQQFKDALNKYSLVPVADPNNPTSLHRTAKALAIKTLQKDSPDLYDPVAVDMRVMKIIDIDPQGLFRTTPAPQPPDPRMVAIQEKAQANLRSQQIDYLETQIKAAQAQATLADKAQERQSRERIAAMKIELERLKIQEEMLIHGHEAGMDQAARISDIRMKEHETALKGAVHVQDLQADLVKQHAEMRGNAIKSDHELSMERERHRLQMEHDKEEHALKMQHLKEMHNAKLEAAKKAARVRKKPEKKDG